MTYENIKIEIQDYVGIITLNRPEALNALCADLISELGNNKFQKYLLDYN